MEVNLDYKGMFAHLELKKGEEMGEMELGPPNADERIQREFLPICLCYITEYKEKGRVPTFEEAKALI